MAQRTIVHLVDDVDGKELGPGEGETVHITLDGASYELDLSAANAQRLRKDFGKWLSNARKVSKEVSGRRSSSDSESQNSAHRTRAIREWARANGYDLSDRGRIPADVVNAFEAHR